MIHMIYLGGLGNQMFQYAFLLALRSKGYKVLMDVSYYDFVKMHNGYELERVFGISERLINRQGLHILWLRILNKLRPKGIYMIDGLSFDNVYLQNPQRYLWGYWQDERYFKDVDKKVKEAFRFRNIDERNLAIAQEMREVNSVSLHVRRGDYAAFGMNLMGIEYYQRAIDYINSKVNEPVFYIFSDDVTVASAIADKMGIKYKMITHNSGPDSYKDMYLMSQCKHNITANSSFSWWGAWLNDRHGKIVVSPKHWNEKNSKIHPQVTGWVLF